eukprot:TRINITY_DN16311_c0_g1_i5.p1 TRINITY_DN16311_c0_g1~~TRINITY_DN16311_c0_g1_i5.p1  ORF type:complete len:332 (-),score=91.42 TRINITY_DN16311_c0_g1_i5:320-1315(-)
MDDGLDDEVVELMLRELGPSPSRAMVEAFVDRLSADKEGDVDINDFGNEDNSHAVRDAKDDAEQSFLRAAVAIQKVQRGRAERQKLEKQQSAPPPVQVVPDAKPAQAPGVLSAQSIEQLLLDAQWLWEMLLAEAVHEEAGDVLRERLHHEIQQYQHPGDGLSLEEHLWLDISGPVVKQLLHPLLQEVIFEGAQDYVTEMRATRVLTELLGATVNPLALDVALEVLQETRVEAVLSELVEAEVTLACRGVAEEQLGILESSNQMLSSEQDFDAVCEAASHSILNETVFRHLLTMLGTRGALWDFEEFLGGPWCDQLIAAVVVVFCSVLIVSS